MPNKKTKKTPNKARNNKMHNAPAKNSKARPLKSLATNYRQLNVYRFVRETIPSTATFDLIAAANYGAMGYMSFENLQLGQLPGVADFVNLFARYKVDKIETTLVPLYQVATQVNHSSQLDITIVNTKYMTNDFPIAANADLQLAELAQLQAKSKRLYAGDKPLKITTINPGVNSKSVVNSAGNEVDARRGCPWLALGGTDAAIDVPFKHNAIIFGARVDGLSLDTSYKYRITHRIFFRCSQVG